MRFHFPRFLQITRFCSLIMLTCLGFTLQGQTPDLAFAEAITGVGGAEGRSIAVDHLGNTIVCGDWGGTIDFDPDPNDSLIVTTAGFTDAFITKFSPTGDLEWAVTLGANGYDEANAVTVDDSGNVIVAGGFQTTVDFDPGPGVMNLTSPGGSNGFVLKLSPTGDLVWVKQLGQTSSSTLPSDIKLDGDAQIFLIGEFNGTVDFDPGPDTLYLSSFLWDVFVAKLDVAGDLIWVKQIGGTGNDYGEEIGVDAAGNVALTGYFRNTVDFDPGPGTANLVSAGNDDIFIAKLDSAGEYMWAHRYGDNFEDRGYGIDVDDMGNVFATGFFRKTVDFDPGPGTFFLGSSGPINAGDIYVTKLDPAGNFVFVKKMGGGGGDIGYSLALDSAGNIYTTGSFANTADFDPGFGDFDLTAPLNTHIFVSKLDPQGNFRYAFSQGGASGVGHRGQYITSRFGCAHITGYFYDFGDFDPGPDTLTLGSSSSQNTFIQKVCDPVCIPTSGSTALSGCPPFLSPGGNQVWTNSGTFQDTLTNVGGCDSVLTVTFTALGNTTATSHRKRLFNSYTAPSGAIYTTSGTLTGHHPQRCRLRLHPHHQPHRQSHHHRHPHRESVCNSYTAPSGAVYTTSGTIQDTIPNAAGCDSILTINLTVNPTTTATLTEIGLQQLHRPQRRGLHHLRHDPGHHPQRCRLRLHPHHQPHRQSHHHRHPHRIRLQQLHRPQRRGLHHLRHDPGHHPQRCRLRLHPHHQPHRQPHHHRHPHRKRLQQLHRSQRCHLHHLRYPPGHHPQRCRLRLHPHHKPHRQSHHHRHPHRDPSATATPPPAARSTPPPARSRTPSPTLPAATPSSPSTSPSTPPPPPPPPRSVCNSYTAPSGAVYTTSGTLTGHHPQRCRLRLHPHHQPHRQHR